MKKPPFELSNEQRSYLGLEPVQPTWERVLLGDAYLYFDGDHIRKYIAVKDDAYFEKALNETTTDNRTMVLPKTARGKPKKLNATAIQSFSTLGVYFQYVKDSVIIANYTTQTTYHYEKLGEHSDVNTLSQWLSDWIANSNADDVADINAFKHAKRQRCKYKVGDFFAIKLDRRRHAIGRILLDVGKLKKDGRLSDKNHYGLTQLAGKPLIVKVYHFITSDLRTQGESADSIDLQQLADTQALPSQAIMDNHLFYGEHPIIGHLPLQDSELDMLISYSRSIRQGETKLTYLQYGLIYKEKTIDEYSGHLYLDDDSVNEMLKSSPYRKEGIGFGIDTTRLEDCIAAGNNQPYWQSTHRFDIRFDLRNPCNQQAKHDIFAAFGLDADKSYIENLTMTAQTQE